MELVEHISGDHPEWIMPILPSANNTSEVHTALENVSTFNQSTTEQSKKASEEQAEPSTAGSKPRTSGVSTKDRHTKVKTRSGLKDRRIRLSAPAAIAFYDVQERLGVEHPSATIEWLLYQSTHAIRKLPPLPDGDESVSQRASLDAQVPPIINYSPASQDQFPQQVRADSRARARERAKQRLALRGSDTAWGSPASSYLPDPFLHLNPSTQPRALQDSSPEHHLESGLLESSRMPFPSTLPQPNFPLPTVTPSPRGTLIFPPAAPPFSPFPSPNPSTQYFPSGGDQGSEPSFPQRVDFLTRGVERYYLQSGSQQPMVTEERTTVQYSPSRQYSHEEVLEMLAEHRGKEEIGRGDGAEDRETHQKGGGKRSRG